MTARQGEVVAGGGARIPLRSRPGALTLLLLCAITRTRELIAAKASPVVALAAGYHRALLVGSLLMAAAALIALRISNTRAAAPIVLVSTETDAQQVRR